MPALQGPEPQPVCWRASNVMGLSKRCFTVSATPGTLNDHNGLSLLLTTRQHDIGGQVGTAQLLPAPRPLTPFGRQGG
jgi:hypothetical protein